MGQGFRKALEPVWPFALPNDLDSPAQRPKLVFASQIPLGISDELVAPEGGVGVRPISKATARMLMPEAAVNENRGSVPT